MSYPFGYNRDREPFIAYPPGYYYDNYPVDSSPGYFNDRRPFDQPYFAFEPRRRHIGSRGFIDHLDRSQSILRGTEVSGGSKPVATGTKDSLPFGKAMKKLHQRLELAQTLYTNFQGEYDDDVKNLRRYMKEEALVDMWVKKVASESSNQNQYQNNNDDPRKYEEKFAEQKMKVTHDLEQVVRSTVQEGGTSRKGTTRLEATKRLRQKVETSRGQILKLLDSAAQAPDNCTALLDELQYLKDLIDPAIEKNAELYTDSPDEERDDVGEGEE